MGKKFRYEFEDIRRNATPVDPSGLGAMVTDPDDPEEEVLAVDLESDEPSVEKVPAAAKPDADDDARRREVEGRRRERRTDTTHARELAQARAEVGQELADMRKELAELKGKGKVEELDAKFEESKAAIEKRIEDAMEAGNSGDQAKALTELTELTARHESERKAALKEAQQDNQEQGGEPPPNARGVQFVNENADWWNDPKHAAAKSFCLRLDKQLIGKGFHPDNDDYWRLFEKNLDAKFPGLRGQIDDLDLGDDDIDLGDGGGKDDKGGTTTSPVLGETSRRRSSTGGGKPKNAGGKVRLTARHISNMREFGLDPSNPDHAAEYARNLAD